MYGLLALTFVQIVLHVQCVNVPKEIDFLTANEINALRALKFEDLPKHLQDVITAYEKGQATGKRSARATVPKEIDFPTAEEIKALRVLKFEDLPKHLQKVIRDYEKSQGKRAVGDNSHWCCSINPVKTIVNSYQVQKYTTTQHHQKYYTKCGFLGWSRCSRSRVIYKQSIYYQQMLRYKQVKTTCPSSKVTCCKGFLQISNHCLPLEKVPDIADDLLKLKQMGLLKG